MNFRRTLLVLTVLTASITVYAESLGLTPQGSFELLITIEGVVIAELGLYEVLRMSEQTELTIKLRAKKKKMGFSVESENRTIKDAYPMFDGARCMWEDDDGSLHKAKDLNVGAEPCFFYPLLARTEQLSYCTNIVLTEIKNDRDIFFDQGNEKYSDSDCWRWERNQKDLQAHELLSNEWRGLGFPALTISRTVRRLA